MSEDFFEQPASDSEDGLHGVSSDIVPAVSCLHWHEPRKHDSSCMRVDDWTAVCGIRRFREEFPYISHCLEKFGELAAADSSARPA